MFRRRSSDLILPTKHTNETKVGRISKNVALRPVRFVSYFVSFCVIRGQQKVCWWRSQSPISLAAAGLADAPYRLRRRRGRDVEHTGVLAVVQDSDMRGARVFCGLIRD